MKTPKLLQERPLYDEGLKIIRNADDGVTIKELAKAMGITERVARSYIDRWVANKEIYIHDWVRNERFYFIPVYRIQTARRTMRHKPKPPKLTKAEKWARYKGKTQSSNATALPPPSDNIILSTLIPTMKGASNGKRTQAK